MIEILRLPEVQRLIAAILALTSAVKLSAMTFHHIYRNAFDSEIADVMRTAPHDGQAGMGAMAAGLMYATPVAFIVFFGLLFGIYFIVTRLLRAWEASHTRKLDEQDRAASHDA